MITFTAAASNAFKSWGKDTSYKLQITSYKLHKDTNSCDHFHNQSLWPNEISENHVTGVLHKISSFLGCFHSGPFYHLQIVPAQAFHSQDVSVLIASFMAHLHTSWHPTTRFWYKMFIFFETHSRSLPLLLCFESFLECAAYTQNSYLRYAFLIALTSADSDTPKTS